MTPNKTSGTGTPTTSKKTNSMRARDTVSLESVVSKRKDSKSLPEASKTPILSDVSDKSDSSETRNMSDFKEGLSEIPEPDQTMEGMIDRLLGKVKSDRIRH
jgi:hypothetical protein